jgi:hypothetical protein
MSLKEGVGESWETLKYGTAVPRWFTYWTAHDVDAALRSAGLELVESATQAGSQESWIIRIARRRCGDRAW